ncbi:MAG: class II aldolase/adducin family protein [Armatimonadetes bacterium]|nr:class II aldolase/adducin family protein [Armatimonadota bacterium]
MSDPRSELIEICRLVYGRRLTDSAGGNMSVRSDGLVYMTPRYSGSKRRWQLKPEEFIVTTEAGEVQEGEGELSRESKMHLAIYRAFPEAGAVVHAHPFHVMVFASAERPIPPTSEQTDKFGEIELTDQVKAHSQALADAVVVALDRKRENLAKNAIACLIPRHGIVCVGRDLSDAYDCLERIEGSAHILIARAALECLDYHRHPEHRD